MKPRDGLSLLWVWASISAASWMGPVAGSRPSSWTPLPPAPRLSLSPPHGTFVPGGRVLLTCSAPESRRAEEFLFYKLKPGGQWKLQIQQKEDSWEIPTAHLEQNSTFICTYTEMNSAGEPLQSASSNPCVVSTELPPAALSLDPKHPVYLQGESVTLTCSAPEGQQVSGYLFYKEQPGQTLQELPDTGQGPYKVLVVDQRTAGRYRCAYWTLLSGREIQSPRSSLVSVTLTECPGQPHFSVSPKQEVYRSGASISLTCLAPDSCHVSEITILKGSQPQFLTRLASPQHNFTQSFQLLPQDGGSYSCRYRTVESGRKIPSPTSNVISISVIAFPEATVPEPSAPVPTAHTYETTARVTDSPRAPASLQPPSSQPALEENSHSAEPDGPATSVPGSSQPTLQDSTSSNTDSQSSTKTVDSQSSREPGDSQSSTDPGDSQSSTDPGGSQSSTEPGDSWGITQPFDSQGSRKPCTDSGDPRSTSQRRTASEPENRNGPQTTDLTLVAACSAAGGLLLVFLACLLWRKLKDLQETAKPQEVDQDWGILPKPNTASSRPGAPSTQGTADKDIDSGDASQFSDIDLTYTLRGYTCSTFFHVETNAPAKDAHVYEALL